MSSYNGTISTLNLQCDSRDKFSLTKIASTKVCAPNPSWLTLDLENNVLYCTEPGVESGIAGTLHSLTILLDGSLLPLNSISTPMGAAHTAIFKNKQALSTAYYISGTLGIYDIRNPERLSEIQLTNLQLPKPGPTPVQTQARPHEIIADPTGRFILVPELGADSVRIFQISEEPATLNHLVEVLPLQLSPGSGPRHAVFVELDETTFLYVINQISNAVACFVADYSDPRTLKFSTGSQINLLLGMDGCLIGPQQGKDIKSSEIEISPDKRFYLASLRGDCRFKIQSPINKNQITIADSLLTYKIEASTGKLKLVDVAPAVGSFPRHFSLNSAGTLIAVAVQNYGWVAVLERDLKTGRIGRVKAVADGLGVGGVVCVLWDETGH